MTFERRAAYQSPMEVFVSAASAGALRGCAVAIGNFDGVHRGHRALFDVARAAARDMGGLAVAMTFDPHPARVLRPALAPPTLTTLSRKLELFAEHGLDAAVVQPFDHEYARREAAEFIEGDLARGLGAAHVVVGHDYTAGKGRTRVDGMRAWFERCGIGLSVLAPITMDGLVVSSTKIREFLLEGNVEAAAELLGRPHDVDGLVERGHRLGQRLGFATANLRPSTLLPANGVYAVRATVAGVRYDGVCNVGVKPTVQDDGAVTAETHLFDFETRELYDERLRISFVARLREERRFPSLEALGAQISADVERARALLRASR